jgi:mannose-6-phosphate isomerase
LREANPHMHLLEACLAWAEVGEDPGWEHWARGLVELAHTRFIRADTGALGEQYTADWHRAPGLAGCMLEPGHHFEWAWLLMRWTQRYSVARVPAALRLIDIAEQFGVVDGLAVNRLRDDFAPPAPRARFWPQTERLKAALFAAQLTDEPRHWQNAAAAARSFFDFLNPDTPGLWFDERGADGVIGTSSAPASTLYHIVGALLALHRTLPLTA